jgi:transposase-like protein
MPQTTYRKSSLMRLIERTHPGRSIEEIVADACRRHDTPEGAAGELGVSRTTLANWQELFGQVESQPIPLEVAR